MRALVAGGGIGGLTTALALCQAGWQVTVIEQATDFGEVGAGIQLSPNGVRILERLGVMPHLEATLFEPPTLEMRKGHGDDSIFKFPLGDASIKRWGSRFITVYRPDLINALLQALNPWLQQQDLQLLNGEQLVRYEQEEPTVRVRCESGNEYSADLLVGADGIQSVVQAQMLGPSSPRFTGNVAWRAVIPVSRFSHALPPAASCIWVGDSKHAVTTRVCGGDRVNFVGCVEQHDWREEGWSIRGTKEEALADFAGWNEVVTECINNAPELYRWALYDRKPLDRWSDKRVVLLGDAAHPMLPSMAQGAVQAIEDAWELSRILAQASPAEAGEILYKKRMQRTRRVQRMSATNMKLFHTRGTLKQFLAFEPARLAGKFTPGLLMARQDWLYRYGMDA